MKEIPETKFFKKRESRSGIEVVSLRELFRRQASIAHRLDRPHRIDFFSVILFTKGSGSHFVDFRSFPYSKGSVLITSKGQVHAFDPREGTDGIQLLVTEEFMRRHGLYAATGASNLLAARSGRTPLVTPGDDESKDLPRIFAAIAEEYRHGEDAFREDILACLVGQLFLSIGRSRAKREPAHAQSPHGETFSRFEKLIAANICMTRNARDYADRIGVSYKHLNEVCKETTGLTAKEFIDGELVLEIKRRLATLELSAKEIAAQTGFDEPTNFVKFFRARTGLTPTQFRESLR